MALRVNLAQLPWSIKYDATLSSWAIHNLQASYEAGAQGGV